MSGLSRMPATWSVQQRLEHRREILPSGCWRWTAARSVGSGYGVISIDRKRHYAHRLAYELYVGPIPKGLQLDHTCHSADPSCAGGAEACAHRLCFNPDHLEPVTPQENTLRGMSAGAIAQRREACEIGHAYAEYGVVNSKGRRVCRYCRTAYMRVRASMTFSEIADRKSAGLPVVDLRAVFADSNTVARFDLENIVFHHNGLTGMRWSA